jgi:hypothetical protein
MRLRSLVGGQQLMSEVGFVSPTPRLIYALASTIEVMPLRGPGSCSCFFPVRLCRDWA